MKIQIAYEAGEGSCRQLAERFGVSVGAVQSRCKREGWRKSLAKFGHLVDQKIDQKIDQLANRRAETLAEKAERFVSRTVDESVDWLDQIQLAKEKLEDGDTGGLKDLIRAWEVPVRVGRTALKLDVTETQLAPAVNIALLTLASPQPVPEAGTVIVDVDSGTQSIWGGEPDTPSKHVDALIEVSGNGEG